MKELLTGMSVVVFICGSLLSCLFIPILQRELDILKDVVWNSHRIRCQKDTYLPDGIPEHIYNFPEEYKPKDCGKSIYYTLHRQELSKQQMGCCHTLLCTHRSVLHLVMMIRATKIFNFGNAYIYCKNIM